MCISKEYRWIIVRSVGIYLLTSAIAASGALVEFVRSSQNSWTTELESISSRGDSYFYTRISEKGYTYSPGYRSDVAFFPLYPVMIRAVCLVTNLSPTLAALLISNLLLAAAFVGFGIYAHERLPPVSDSVATYALLSLGLFPPTFFFRVAYSEACFLFLSVMTLVLINRKAPLYITALLIGLATASRPVGIALLIPFATQLFEEISVKRPSIVRLVPLAVLPCWGLLFYMAYLQFTFNNALAFAETQDNYRLRPNHGLTDKVVALASAEPIWSVYDANSSGYWNNMPDVPYWLVSLRFANPIYFVGMCALSLAGWWKGWMNRYELGLVIGLLAIPYITRSYEMCMLSHGRFAAVCFPSYLVMGQVFSRAGKLICLFVLGLFSVFLATYMFLFVDGYALI